MRCNFVARSTPDITTSTTCYHTTGRYCCKSFNRCDFRCKHSLSRCKDNCSIHNKQELEYQLCQEETQVEPQEVLLQQLQHKLQIPTLVTNQNYMNLQFWVKFWTRCFSMLEEKLGNIHFNESIAETFLLMLNVKI